MCDYRGKKPLIYYIYNITHFFVLFFAILFWRFFISKTFIRRLQNWRRSRVSTRLWAPSLSTQGRALGTLGRVQEFK